MTTFDQAVRQYRPEMLRRARRWTADAEDVVQNALLEAWRSWRPEIETIGPWLFTILRRTWTRMRVAAQTLKRGAEPVQLDDVDDASLAIPATQESAAEWSRVERLMQRRLNANQRSSVMLYAAGWSTPEIGEIKDMSHQAVQQHIAIARKRLRRP